MRQQCAWCLIDLETGEQLAMKDLTARRGICIPCKDREMAKWRKEFKQLVKEEKDNG